MREEVLDDGVKSILTIMENNFDYFGKYSCIVINSYGSDTLEIEFGEPSELTYSNKVLRVFRLLLTPFVSRKIFNDYLRCRFSVDINHFDVWAFYNFFLYENQ